MKWIVEHGNIKADGEVQDAATYLWTLQSAGQDIQMTRTLLIDAKRLPALRRLGFGKERDTEVIAARRAGGPPEIIPVIQDGKPVEIPAQYRQEIGAE